MQVNIDTHAIERQLAFSPIQVDTQSLLRMHFTCKFVGGPQRLSKAVRYGKHAAIAQLAGRAPYGRSGVLCSLIGPDARRRCRLRSSGQRPLSRRSPPVADRLLRVRVPPVTDLRRSHCIYPLHEATRGHKRTVAICFKMVSSRRTTTRCDITFRGSRMIDSSAVMAVFSVYVAGVVIPGPNFVAVAHRAASGARSDAFALVAGIVLVNLFWATCAILGVGIVFAVFPWLALMVRIAGAGYLIWFGLRLIVHSRAKTASEANPVLRRRFRSAFVQGLATNIANPKSIAFFAAVFSSAAPTRVSLATFTAMLAIVGATATLWYGFVALVLSHSAIASTYRRFKAWTDRVCGAVIVALGIRQLAR